MTTSATPTAPTKPQPDRTPEREQNPAVVSPRTDSQRERVRASLLRCPKAR